MSTTMLSESAATSVIVHDVKPAHLGDYQHWMVKAKRAHQQFAGYVATDIIRPMDSSLRYVVILRFATDADANAWLISDIRRELLNESLPWLMHEDRYQVHQGDDFWFAPTSSAKSPQRWKQWVLSMVALVPLATLVPFGLSRTFDSVGIRLSESAVTALSLVIISALMVYWLMPALTRLANKWLLQ